MNILDLDAKEGSRFVEYYYRHACDSAEIPKNVIHSTLALIISDGVLNLTYGKAGSRRDKQIIDAAFEGVAKLNGRWPNYMHSDAISFSHESKFTAQKKLVDAYFDLFPISKDRSELVNDIFLNSRFLFSEARDKGSACSQNFEIFSHAVKKRASTDLTVPFGMEILSEAQQSRNVHVIGKFLSNWALPFVLRDSAKHMFDHDRELPLPTRAEIEAKMSVFRSFGYRKFGIGKKQLSLAFPGEASSFSRKNAIPQKSGAEKQKQAQALAVH